IAEAGTTAIVKVKARYYTLPNDNKLYYDILFKVINPISNVYPVLGLNRYGNEPFVFRNAGIDTSVSDYNYRQQGYYLDFFVPAYAAQAGGVDHYFYRLNTDTANLALADRLHDDTTANRAERIVLIDNSAVTPPSSQYAFPAAYSWDSATK